MSSECASIEKPQCPQCGSTEHVIPIIYGKPTQELLDEWAKYEIVLGAHIKIHGRQPPWTCTQCNIFIDIPDDPSRSD